MTGMPSMEGDHLRAICIIGSPTGGGSTALLVDRIIDGMAAAGIATDRFVLGELSIGYCRGCRTCESSGRCVQMDDMDRLLEGIMAADVVVLASPSYWGDVTGQMKVFIDRSLSLCNAKSGETPVPPGKVGVAVAVRAGRSPAENQHLLDTFAHYFLHLGIESAASLTVEGVNTRDDMEAARTKLAAAYRLGLSLPELSTKR